MKQIPGRFCALFPRSFTFVQYLICGRSVTKLAPPRNPLGRAGWCAHLPFQVCSPGLSRCAHQPFHQPFQVCSPAFHWLRLLCCTPALNLWYFLGAEGSAMVFESAVVELLNRFLKPYVKKLDTSQLKVAVWKGNETAD